jgi:hypothetical protein
MKKPWLAIILLILLCAAGFILISNCGGAQLIKTTEETSKGWQLVGEREVSSYEVYFTGISLFVYHGTPYIAYNGSHLSTIIGPNVAKYNGTTWESVGDLSFPIGFITNRIAGSAALFVDNGVPYLACIQPFIIGTDPKGSPITEMMSCVLKNNGLTWEAVGGSIFTAGVADYIPLYVYNGTPYVAYSDPAQAGKVAVVKFNGSNWETVGPTGFALAGPTDVGMLTGVALCVYNATPYIAFKDAANGNRASVMKFNGSDWENVGTPGFSSGEAAHISFTVNNTVPYIAFEDKSEYQDKRGVTQETYTTTVMRFNGASWERVGDPGISYEQAEALSLSVYNGIPYIVYEDMEVPSIGAASLKRFNGTDWEYIGGRGFTFGHAAMYTTLFIDNGIPFIAYRDGTSGKLTVMKYIE